ncbi:MAG: FeoB-associated Cys-rich membrane protein [Pseudodesulfovibrio sp.]|nr:FeoB-associated Cys-rich membrane protein [Pseudodesulfovibrio sp.]
MLDTIIVLTIIAIAASFVGRTLYRQFSSKSAGCSCSGCGQSNSCSTIRNKSNSSNCSGLR